MSILLDIDCTLNDMRRRIFEAVISRFPVAGLSVENAMSAYYYVQDIKELQGNSEVKEFINNLIADEAWLSSLSPLPGAVESVNRLSALNLVQGYITTRSESQRDVTLAWLKQHGFPELPLKMRPASANKNWESWKTSQLESAKIIIDDHLKLPEALEANDCDIKLIHFGQKTYSDSYKNAVACPDWKAVMNAISKDFPNVQ